MTRAAKPGLTTVALAATALMTATACARCSSSSPDGGDVDAGLADASTDTPSDSRADADTGGDVRDAVVADVPATSGMDWPGWHRLPGFTDYPLNEPDDVATSFPNPLIWLPCADAGAGCEGASVLAYPDAINDVHGSSGTGVAGVAPLWQTSHSTTDSYTGETDVIDLRTGRVIAAIRAGKPSDDSFADLVVGAGGFAVFAGTTILGPHAARYHAGDVFHEPSWTVADASLWPGGQTSATSDTLYAFDRQPQNMLVRVPMDGKPVTSVLGGTLGVAVLMDFVQGGDTYALSEHGATGWAQEYVYDANAKFSLYLDKTGRHIGPVASDGTYVFWCEQWGGVNPTDTATPQTEIFVAPYSADGAKVRANAKKLATLNQAFEYQGFAQDGVFKVNWVDSAMLFRADGTWQQIKSGDGAYVGRTGLLFENKLYLSMGYSPTMRRYALGAWNPAM